MTVADLISSPRRFGSIAAMRGQGSHSDRSREAVPLPALGCGQEPVFASLKMKTVDLYRRVHSSMYSVVRRFGIHSRVGSNVISERVDKGFTDSVTAL